MYLKIIFLINPPQDHDLEKINLHSYAIFLFFLKSIVQEVAGEPEAALASLLTADQLHPKFDSTQLNLALLYHKLAATTNDLKRKKLFSLAARDRYVEFIALTYRGRPAPPEVQKQLAEFESDCAATKPVP